MLCITCVQHSLLQLLQGVGGYQNIAFGERESKVDRECMRNFNFQSNLKRVVFSLSVIMHIFWFSFIISREMSHYGLQQACIP